MAALCLSSTFSGLSLSAATTKTVWVCTAPTNQRIKITGFNLSFNGTVNSNTPISVTFQQASAAGTSTSHTPVAKEPECTETPTGTYGINHTVEPTYTANKVHRVFYVHPQLGQEVYFPQGQEIMIKGGGIMGIAINAPQAVSVSGFVDTEE